MVTQHSFSGTWPGLRFVLTSSIVLLILIHTGSSQQITDPPRTILVFHCPAYSIFPSPTLTLHADVLGAKEIIGEKRASLLSYRWKASGATIISGQESQNVTIDTQEISGDGSVHTIDLELTVSGLPPEQANGRICSIKIDPKCSQPQVFAHYGNLALADEKLVLDRLAKYLMNSGAGSIAYLVVYSGQSACMGEAEWRASRAQRYMVHAHSINVNRIITVDGGFRDNLTVEIFTAAVDSCGPFTAPTLLPSSAHIQGFCEDKYGTKN